MSLSKRQLLVFALCLVAALLIGVLFGFLLGKNAACCEQPSQKTRYKATASLYIHTGSLTDTEYISSSDLSVDPSIFDGIAEVLDRCSAEIAYKYPGVEYNMALEQAESTSICKIVVTGEDPEQITEVCNMAAGLLPEKVSSTIDGISCKVIDLAKIPTEPIE